MKKYAVIVAAGNGSRMGNQIPKQFLMLAGKPILLYSIEAFLKSFFDINIILVVPYTHLDTATSIVSLCPENSLITVLAGADSRFGSVKIGLEKTSDDAVIFIHDGVRCLLSEDLILRCYEGALKNGNAIPAIGSVDSVRIQKKGGNESVPREYVKLVQTPQTFRGKIIRDAFKNAKGEHFTDEAAVAESNGVQVHLVEGEQTNLKITHPADMLLADLIIRERNLISSEE
ncbi:MAG: 2-C-methyl-D-erythritol 4-phosphate cytidylyltransferase [Flavitalea sp.]